MTDLQKQLQNEQQRCFREITRRMAVGETMDSVMLSCCIREDHKLVKKDLLKLNESVQQGRLMMKGFRDMEAEEAIDRMVDDLTTDCEAELENLKQFYEKYLDRAVPVRQSSDPAQELRHLLKSENGPMTLHIMSDTLSATAQDCGDMLHPCGDLSEDEVLLVIAASTFCAQLNVLGELIPCSNEELAATVGYSVGVQADAYHQIKETLDVSSARKSAEKIISILHVMSALLTYLVFGGAFLALHTLCFMDSIDWFITFFGQITYFGIVLAFLIGGFAVYCVVDDLVDKLHDYYEDRGIAKNEEKLRQRELARKTWQMLDATFELPDMEQREVEKVFARQVADDDVESYDYEDDTDYTWRMVSVWD